MTASSAPTSAVSSSATRIFCSTPAAGDGISVSTLSVETSSKGSSSSTRSPSCLSQRVTVPSVTLSPSRGMVTDTGMLRTPSVSSVVSVQGLAGQGQVSLTQRLVLRRVGVDQLRHLGREGFPVHDKLRLTDLLAD